MPRYSVQVSIGALTTEVEAADADEAIQEAHEEWVGDAYDIINNGTFEAREIEDG